MLNFLIGLVTLVTALTASKAAAKLAVVTTTTDLAAVVRAIGEQDATVESICKGTQDPHYLEAKPSFILKVNRADLVVAIGLDLEIGWLPSILKGARNESVMKGGLGYLEVGPLVDVLEIHSEPVTRADGDVHPDGNPHVTLDPIRLGNIALIIAERMGALDPPHRSIFLERATLFQRRLVDKAKLWQKRITESGVTQVVTHHKTLTYFLDRFGLKNPAILEPKPGVPPTSKHTINIIRIVRSQHIPLILVENYFEASVAQRIAKDVPTTQAASVPVAVEGAPGITTPEELFERLVTVVERRL